MELNDFLLRVKDLDEKHLRLKLHDLIRHNYSYRILNIKNQEFVLDLVMKYRNKWRRGIGISQQSIDREYREIYKNRSELDLKANDLSIIKEVLMFFKR